jgi:hypothetical protein
MLKPLNQIQSLSPEARQLVREGYPLGNDWEGMLRRSLPEASPQLFSELTKTKGLETFLVRQTSRALGQYETMVAQGTPELMAKELVLTELLEPRD